MNMYVSVGRPESVRILILVIEEKNFLFRDFF